MDGSICLDILDNNWTPVYEVINILDSIIILLSNPNPVSPANNEAAKLYQENKQEYKRKVIACVEKTFII